MQKNASLLPPDSPGSPQVAPSSASPAWTIQSNSRCSPSNTSGALSSNYVLTKPTKPDLGKTTATPTPSSIRQQARSSNLQDICQVLKQRMVEKTQMKLERTKMEAEIAKAKTGILKMQAQIELEKARLQLQVLANVRKKVRSDPTATTVKKFKPGSVQSIQLVNPVATDKPVLAQLQATTNIHPVNLQQNIYTVNPANKSKRSGPVIVTPLSSGVRFSLVPGPMNQIGGTNYPILPILKKTNAPNVNRTSSALLVPLTKALSSATNVSKPYSSNVSFAGVRDVVEKRATSVPIAVSCATTAKPTSIVAEQTAANNNNAPKSKPKPRVNRKRGLGNTSEPAVMVSISKIGKHTSQPRVDVVNASVQTGKVSQAAGQIDRGCSSLQQLMSTDEPTVDLRMFEQFKIKPPPPSSPPITMGLVAAQTTRPVPMETATVATATEDIKPNLEDLMKTVASNVSSTTPVESARKSIEVPSDVLVSFCETKKKSGFGSRSDSEFINHLLNLERNAKAVTPQAAATGRTAGASRDKTAGCPSASINSLQGLLATSPCKDNTGGQENLDISLEEVTADNLEIDLDDISESQSLTLAGNDQGSSVSSLKRHASVTSEELQQLQTAGKKLRKGPVGLSEVTKKQMNWAVNVLKDWLKEKGYDTFFECQSAVWLNEKLERFYVEVRALDGTPYSPIALQQFKQSMSWYLANPPFCRKIHLNFDPDFNSSNQVLSAVIKSRKAATPETKYSIPISAPDLERLYNSHVLTDQNPVTLSWKVWFDVTYHLCRARMPRDYQRKMKKQDLVLKCDDKGVYYTLAESAIPPLWNETDAPIGKMYATPHNEARCPVRTTNLYLQRLCAGCDVLFQFPKKGWKNERDRWYHPLPIGRNKLAKMMSIIAKAAGLSRTYTNTSVLVTSRCSRIGGSVG